jgi:hypothetical protein
MLLTILIILLIFALLGGAFGTGRYGGVAWSPVGLLLLIVLILLLTGNI